MKIKGIPAVSTCAVIAAAVLLVATASALISPVRDMPATVEPGESFFVNVTWTFDEDNSNSVGLHDEADAEAGMSVTVKGERCNLAPFLSNTPNDYTAEYMWLGPYNSSQTVTAVYKVDVPADAIPGTYTFNGQVSYFVGAEEHTVPVSGVEELRIVSGATASTSMPEGSGDAVLPSATTTPAPATTPVTTNTKERAAQSYLETSPAQTEPNPKSYAPAPSPAVKVSEEEEETMAAPFSTFLTPVSLVLATLITMRLNMRKGCSKKSNKIGGEKQENEKQKNE